MKDPQTKSGTEEESLATERDIDEEFGLFREGSFPDALPEEDQIEAVRHALPEDGGTSKDSSKRS